MNHITSFSPTEIISLQQGQPVTTSLKVAEVFGKQHKNVLQKIESLECPPEFMSANFSAHEEIIQAGAVKRASKNYEMTKDGFMLLVMGFTGKQAMATKIAFINAFNWMAEQLSQQAPQGIRIPAPNSPDNTYCGRLLVSVEFDRITNCRPLPGEAFIATPATVTNHLRENWSITNEQLRAVAETCLHRLTERATLPATPQLRCTPIAISR